MVEANDNPELISFTRVREHERARKQTPPEPSGINLDAVAATLSGEVHVHGGNESLPGTTTGTLQVSSEDQATSTYDPEASARHLRFGITALLVVLLVALWIYQRRRSS